MAKSEYYEPMDPKDREMCYFFNTVFILLPSLVGGFSPQVNPEENLLWLRIISWIGIIVSLAIFYGLRYDRKKEKEIYGK